MIYSDYKRNHAILKGRENALHAFLNQNYKGIRHKWKNGFSSHSEDALTWSCFDIINLLPYDKKIVVLDELIEDAFQGGCNFTFKNQAYTNNQIKIFVGKKYEGLTTNEATEVDISIELPNRLIFFEAKLYSSISLADETKAIKYDQIAKKLRVGLDVCHGKEFYFIFLDIAPAELLFLRKSKKEASHLGKMGFYDKWKSAWWFNYYKKGRNNSLKPLINCLEGIKIDPYQKVSQNMGWLTWSDLYKSILRGLIK